MTQRDTTAFQIARANELADIIDAATEYPERLIWEFNGCVQWCEKYGHLTTDEIRDQIRCYQNW